VLPALVARLRPDLHYVANSPSGGALPFLTNVGVSHYYGVGAYQRPLDDARRAGVRFTSECLAFANVPAEQTLAEDLGVAAVHHPRWKAGVPRDAGSAWDFEDVRDHYLRELYAVDPPRLRYEDPQHYLELSRAVVAELMSEVFSEWRRVGSSCSGALVWQLQDLRPGAGWGVLDSRGRPKSAWHALRGVWQPVQVVITDEGLNGLAFHVINETAQPLEAVLEISCLRDGQTSVVSASRSLALAPHQAQESSSASLLERFFDITYAYRFGPPAHDVTLATLRRADTGEVLSEAFHLPDRRALQRGDPGLSAVLEHEDGTWWLVLQSRSFARWVHVVDANFLAESDWFHLAPERPRRVRLQPLDAGRPARIPDGEVRAINAARAVVYRATTGAA
jgi:beta-mannosidase